MAKRALNKHMEAGFIWLPKTTALVIDIKIDGTSVKLYYLSAECTRAISPEIGSFKINILNANGRFSDIYDIGDSVVFYADKTDGTTAIFKGKIDSIKNKAMPYQVLEIGGGHLSSELLDVTVTKEYTGSKSCDEILKELVDNYLTGYTYTNVGASTVSPNIKWSNKPFWTAVEELCNLAKVGSRFDAYVDDDLDFHFFEENSIDNTKEAIVWNNTLLNLDGYGEQSTLSKNKIIVYGDAGGLPIITQDIDSAAQGIYGLKEEIVLDSDIFNISRAEELANTLLENQKEPPTEGSAHCFMLPTIQPGEKIWVSNPKIKINEKIKIGKYTHTFPLKRSNIVLTRRRDIPALFRERMLKDMAQDDIINPFEMTSSLNYTFDDLNNLSNWDSNVGIIDGRIKLTSGTQGQFFTDTVIKSEDITQVQLKLVGEQMTDNTYSISIDGGQNYTSIIPDGLVNVTPGKLIKIAVTLNGAASEIDSMALLMK